MIFKDLSVFDPDYIPDVVRFRDSQLEELRQCLMPALEGYSPLNVMCVGPPATGKTLTIRLTTEYLEGVHVAYVRCLKYRDPFLVYSKIFEDVLGVEPPSGGKSKAAIINKVWKNVEAPVVVVLDDFNFLKPQFASEVLYEILKAPEEHEVKVGVLAASTDRRYPVYLDPFASSLFHYVEISYPPYTREKIREILKWRVRYGFEKDAISEEAFEKVVEITSRAADVRYGIYILRASGVLAGGEGAARVEVEHVERVHVGDAAAYLGKLIAALNSDERAVLRIAYSLDNISTGELFEIVHGEVKMSYRRFYDILEKLERLKLIDVVFDRKGRGRTRYIVKRYEPEVIENVLREF